MVSLYEVALSEFHLSPKQILFEFTLPRLALIVEARVARDERARKESPSTPTQTTPDKYSEMMRMMKE